MIKLSIALLLAAQSAFAQLPAPAAQPAQTEEQQTAERQAAEKQAYELLEEVVSEAQGLRLPENRSRTQIAAADLLWKRDEGRARTLFAEAAAAVGEMLRQVDAASGGPGAARRGFQQAQSAIQVRQEIVLTAARRDAQLAYQLFQSMKRPASAQTASGAVLEGRGFRVRDDESALEERLLALVAASDPATALMKAEEALGRGEYPGSLASVLAQLHGTDKQAAARLTTKLLARLQSDALLGSREAAGLAFTLLRPGPRPPAEAQPTPLPDGTQPDEIRPAGYLPDTSFRDLLDSVVGAALKATPAQTSATNTAGAANAGAAGGRGGGAPRAGGGGARVAQANPRRAQSAAQQQQTPETDTQLRQNNARTLLRSLQGFLPQIDQYLPTRAGAVRQKMTELGFNAAGGARQTAGAVNPPAGRGSVETLLAAAASAPPAAQTRLYQRAALQAAAEGNFDRAKEIAGQHLEENMRAPVTRAIEAQQRMHRARTGQIDELRQQLAGLATDEERVRLLVQLAESTRRDDPKQSLQFLEEARTLAARRATGYQQLDSQLQVARAYAAVDPDQSFQLVEMGINQLNELMPAAALLSGFEVNIFRDGEMSLPGGSGLGAMVTRYGQELAQLARTDFERARATANKFQTPEARLHARLAIVRGTLGATGVNARRGQRRAAGPNAPLFPRPQP